MAFIKKHEVVSNQGLLPIYQQEGNKKHWLAAKDLMAVLLNHQKENTQKREVDGEVMVSLEVALYLLFRVEMDDFTISTTINELRNVSSSPPSSPPLATIEPLSPPI